ncbi:unnamed protein product [Jaminaea pallidilutea]
MVISVYAGLRAGQGLPWDWTTSQNGIVGEIPPSRQSPLRRRRRAQFGPTKQETSASGAEYTGLINTGNSCFFNSVIQSLASLPSFITHLHRLQGKAVYYDVPSPVVDALLELLSALNSPSQRRQRAIRPDHLTGALARRDAGSQANSATLRSLVTAHRQQDAHELLVLLLDALSEERAAVLEEVKLAAGDTLAESSSSQAVFSELHIFSGLSSLLGKSTSVENSTRSAVTAITRTLSGPANPFEALVAQRTACLICGYYDVIRQYSQEELSLNMPLTRWGSAAVPLEDCLEEWARLEPVEWRCWDCTLRLNIARAEAEVRRCEASKEADGNHRDGVANKKTVSAKKRQKEARRTLAVLSAARQGLHTEEEFRHAHSQIKLVAPPSTGGVASATKQVLFSRPPHLLACHLNRSVYAGYGASKNDCRVGFGEWLDLSSVCIRDEGVEAEPQRAMNEVQLYEGQSWNEHNGHGDWQTVHANGKSDARLTTNGNTEQSQNAALLPPKALIYRLCSIVVHYGGHSFGHYVSYRRIGPLQEDWLRISDESVSRCHLRDVLREGHGVVVVFYEKWEGEDKVAKPGGPMEGTMDVPHTTSTNGARGAREPVDSQAQRSNGTLGKSTALEQVNRSYEFALQTRKRARTVERWQVGQRDPSRQSSIAPPEQSGEAS